MWCSVAELAEEDRKQKIENGQSEIVYKALDIRRGTNEFRRAY